MVLEDVSPVSVMAVTVRSLLPADRLTSWVNVPSLSDFR